MCIILCRYVFICTSISMYIICLHPNSLAMKPWIRHTIVTSRYLSLECFNHIALFVSHSILFIDESVILL